MHVSGCDLIKRTLSTLHHQGQPGVDVVTGLLGLGGHRYAGRSQRLAIELREKKRRVEEEDVRSGLLLSRMSGGDQKDSRISRDFFVWEDPPAESSSAVRRE